MYQEDMMNQGDGFGGYPPAPRVSIENAKTEEPFNAAENVGDQMEGVDGAPSSDPYNHSTLATDPDLQRQYHEFLPYTTAYDQRPSRNRSRSPARSRKSPSGSPRRSLSRRNSANAKADSKYHLMPLETEAPQSSDNKSSRRRSFRSQRSLNSEDVNERYEAQVALGIQLALAFFCLLIVVAIAMAIFYHHGYWVVILVCVTILVSLLLSLCCFLYQVVHEEDALNVNQKHMPKWYKTFTKIVKDEINNFREDWMDMCNNVYLLEDGDAGTVMTNSSRAFMPQKNGDVAGLGGMNQKPKKKREKSALFKMVAKPAALLASFRRKRKGKKKQKKAQQSLVPEPTFPSTV